MEGKYQVVQTQPTVYIDTRGNAVQGFLVIVQLHEFDEVHEVRVASLDPKVVKEALDKLHENRQAIAKLSE